MEGGAGPSPEQAGPRGARSAEGPGQLSPEAGPRITFCSPSGTTSGSFMVLCQGNTPAKAPQPCWASCRAQMHPPPAPHRPPPPGRVRAAARECPRARHCPPHTPASLIKVSARSRPRGQASGKLRPGTLNPPRTQAQQPQALQHPPRTWGGRGRRRATARSRASCGEALDSGGTRGSLPRTLPSPREMPTLPHGRPCLPRACSVLLPRVSPGQGAGG